MFTRKYVSDVTRIMTHLKGDCNVGTTYSNLKGWWSHFHMWLVESVIANLLSVPQLEADGFKIDYTNNIWTVTTPEGDIIPFKKDTGKCRGFPYIEMGSLEALALMQSVGKVETVRENYEGFTKRDVKKAVLARKAQAMVRVRNKYYLRYK